MGRLYYVIGKSSAGKDSVFRRLLNTKSLHLKPLVLYTTRPMRDGERQGVEYHFTDEAGLEALQAEGRVIELRVYDTVQGMWKYFTADTEATDLDHADYLGVGVLTSYEALKDYYGEDKVVPIYIEVEDGERLRRALERERAQTQPQYAEMCRRFLADSSDFSEEALSKAGIERRFENTDLGECVREVGGFIADLQKLC